jgi:hypothetical protein
MELQLTSALNRQNSIRQADLNSGNPLAVLDSAQVEAADQRRTTALKAKIMRRRFAKD